MRSTFVATGTPGFTVHDGGTRVRCIFEGTVASPFLSAIAITSLPIGAKSKVLLAAGAGAGSNIEVSVMLDLTGSMCDDGEGPCTSGSKLNALKTAATDLVSIAVWPNQSTITSKVALLPFSTRIRVGPDGGGETILRDLTNLGAAWSGWVREGTSSSGGGGSEDGGHWTCNAYQVFQRNNWRVMPCVTDRTGLNLRRGSRQLHMAQCQRRLAYASELGQRRRDADDAARTDRGRSGRQLEL